MSDLSSDVCSSDLSRAVPGPPTAAVCGWAPPPPRSGSSGSKCCRFSPRATRVSRYRRRLNRSKRYRRCSSRAIRSEEHTSELQSLMRISYAVFCLNKKTTTRDKHTKHYQKSTKDTPYLQY